MLYGAGAAVAAIASLYLLLRRGNAFAPDITTPQRLRMWTAMFFAIMALGHIWYLPTAVVSSSDVIMLSFLIGGLLDCMVTIPLAIIVMLCMLQDRRRPLWPVVVMMAPLIVGLILCIVNCDEGLLPILRLYLLAVGIVLTVYMVHAVRQYGRWLRDNYADLEHKEVWQSFLAIAAILLMFGYYVSGDSGMIYEYIIQVCGIVLVCYLLWRVETLSDLSISNLAEEEVPVMAEMGYEKDSGHANTGTPEDGRKSLSPCGDGSSAKVLSDASFEEIGSLLQQHCIDTELYLQHDLNAAQLAHVLGTNRFDLSMYFARQGTTYNAYINDLRIRHFVRLYYAAVAARRPFTTRQLAADSGYHSYSTFSLAFKQRMGQSVTAWVHDAES